MPKTRARIAALRPAALEDILEDLKGVDFDVRNVAAMLEVTWTGLTSSIGKRS
jgi:hypothetical protein